MSAACGLTIIRYIKKRGILENVRAQGAELDPQMTKIVERYPITGRISRQDQPYNINHGIPMAESTNHKTTKKHNKKTKDTTREKKDHATPQNKELAPG